MKVPLPRLLDGSVLQLYPPAVPRDFCAPQWFCAHLEPLKELLAAYAGVGAGVICAPTGGADPLSLEAKGLFDQMEAFNRSLMEAAVEAAGKTGLAAGVLESTGLGHWEEIPFGRRVDSYAQQALCLKEAGAVLLVIRKMTWLPEARAAVLGARQTELPILVAMEPCDSRLPMEEEAVLAALVVLQELGVEGFGLEGNAPPAVMEPILQRLEGLAKVPLIAKPAAAYSDEMGRATLLSPGAFAAMAQGLIQSGAVLLGGGVGSTPEHIRALSSPSAGAAGSHDRQPAPLVLAGEKGVYYLDEDFTFSQPLTCHLDMSEAVLEAEDCGCDALLVRVSTAADGIMLGENGYLFRMPICLLADSAEALESALFHTTGRLMVDRRSDLPGEELDRIAAGYGALVR
ncbi:homocysteine S-methyltransferase family protein [Oscillospiraceae bacterium MB08-C2-2]|nr:homocysteine S-methyltransferase family protein [Oscillospiraceae bacterium MB08-C2-2]